MIDFYCLTKYVLRFLSVLGKYKESCQGENKKYTRGNKVKEPNKNFM